MSLPADMLEYVHLSSGSTPPSIGHLFPFKAVVLIEDAVEMEWQNSVSVWLVESGCRYMLAHGLNCSSWDDSVDWAAIDVFGDDHLSDANFVRTTWHENETIDEVFWFAKEWAKHSAYALENTLILHISQVAQREALLERYRLA